jgi:hypothetical protein
MDGDRRQSILIFSLITLSGLGYYALNNYYDAWAMNPGTNWFLALCVYYFLSQPLYLLVLYFFYDKYGTTGVLSGILVMVSLDISSVPHSVPSVWPGRTTSVPSDLGLAPYADWQLGRLLANHSGSIGFVHLAILYIAIPTLLDLIALVLVSPDTYESLVENA